MTALARKSAAGIIATSLAALIMFAGYCKLHAVALGVSLPWNAPLSWGMMTGVPAGLLACGLWRWRERAGSSEQALALGICVFVAAVSWGVLVRGVVGPGRLPEAQELAGQLFAVLPMSAALAGAAALILIWRRDRCLEERSPWLDLPEEPLLRLRTDRIGWISAAGNYCEFHSDNRVHLVRVTLARMAERLEGQGFTRIHRSALVNGTALLSIERSSCGSRRVARLRCGTALPIGKRFQADALAAVNCHSSPG